MPRPPIGKPIVVRLPDDLKARLELAMAATGLTMSEIVRRAVDAYLRELR